MFRTLARLGVLVEEAVADLYRAAAERCTPGSTGRTVLETIAGEEDGHAAALREAADLLTDDAPWNDSLRVVLREQVEFLHRAVRLRRALAADDLDMESIVDALIALEDELAERVLMVLARAVDRPAGEELRRLAIQSAGHAARLRSAFLH